SLVAVSILYFDLLGSLKTGVSSMSKAQLSREAAELAHHMATDMQVENTPEKMQKHLIEFIGVYKDDIWAYDLKGKLLFEANDRTTPGGKLDKAREEGLRGRDYMWYDSNNYRGVAASPIEIDGKIMGAVIVSTVAADASNVDYTARRELSYAFWGALIVSSALGFLFAEIIAYQVRALTNGAQEIAAGNFDLRLKGIFLPDEVGDLANSFNTMAEKLRKAFAAIRAQEREMSAVIANMTEGVLEIDAEGKIRLANKAAARLLGLPTSKLPGTNINDLRCSGTLAPVIQRSTDGKAASGVFIIGERVILMHAAPMRRFNGETFATVAILSDVTEQKRLEQAQRDFIANASHELRTPISSLKGFVELLEGGAKDKREVRDSFLGTMQTEIDRLQRLVEELFVLAQFDSGRMELKMAEHSIAKMLDDVVAIASPIGAASGMTIRHMVEADLPDVPCDRDKIVQVLLSFIDNAVKHSENGASVSITGRAAGGNSVEIAVSDEGQGIPEEELRKIFTRFYHRPPAKPGPKGAGLGLSIAKEIIEAHHSKIVVRSKPGAGASFSFTLPAATTHPTERS
ncbi:MAG: ATP-binding protein, partial [Chloroflexi bacterium]|nr:ATP-binding protein [Chloroflexota bacterium]